MGLCWDSINLIPFQRESHSLPFNVAGLDTVKYNNNDFAVKATNAIDIAIYKQGRIMLLRRHQIN